MSWTSVDRIGYGFIKRTQFETLEWQATMPLTKLRFLNGPKGLDICNLMFLPSYVRLTNWPSGSMVVIYKSMILEHMLWIHLVSTCKFALNTSERKRIQVIIISHFWFICLIRPQWVDIAPGKYIYWINTLRPRQNGRFSQTTLSNAFSWMKILEFRLRFHEVCS